MAYSSASRSKSLTRARRKYNSKQSKTFEPPAELQQLLKNPKRQSPLFKKLDDYQQKAVVFSAGLSGSALFFEQGTGKTWITLGLIDVIQPETVFLVVPLTNLTTTWAKNINNELPNYKLCLSWEEFKRNTGKRILLMHYEGMPKTVRRTKRFAFDLVVFDESQRLKKRSSRNSRLARQFRHHKQRVILSGTPMDKSPIEVWAQMRFADYTVFGDTWSRYTDDFGNHFCVKGGWMNKEYLFDEGRREEYLGRLSKVALRVEKADVLDTPKPKIIEVPVMLLGKQRQLYDKMDKTSVIKVNGYRVMASMEATKRIKLAQIANGNVKDDDGEIIYVGSAKERRLRSLIRHVSKRHSLPIVVFCQYKEDIAVARKVLSLEFNRVAVIDGSVVDKKNNKARTQIQNEFQAGKLDALICQQKTGGVGIDLFRSHVCIFFSFGHSWIDFDQAISRLDRRGQERRVFVFLIIALGTIDEDKFLAIKSKCSLTQAILQRLKRN